MTIYIGDNHNSNNDNIFFIIDDKITTLINST